MPVSTNTPILNPRRPNHLDSQSQRVTVQRRTEIEEVSVMAPRSSFDKMMDEKSNENLRGSGKEVTTSPVDEDLRTSSLLNRALDLANKVQSTRYD